jgi:ribosome-binding protein aMBF1 (putative translation factor)
MKTSDELLGLALLRVDLAAEALAKARKAIVAAAAEATAAETAREASNDEWPTNRAEFGAAVRSAREAFGISRAGLAKRTGLSDATIRNAEQGRPCSSHTRALLIAALIKVPS